MVDRLLAPEEARLLDHLYDMAGCTDHAFAADLLAAFLHSTAESLAALDAAVAALNRREVARAAHRLKSSFSTLGMEHGNSVCTALEQKALVASPASLDTARQAVVEVREAEADRARRLLSHLVGWRV